MSYTLNALTPMLETMNLDETIEFYQNILGFDCASYEPDWGWALLEKDGINLMFTLPNEHKSISKPAMSGSIYLKTDNPDDAWEELKDKAEICYPIEDFDYGMREFAIYDNNGYVIQFGKEI